MAVDDDGKRRFLELKAKRSHRFIIYKIDEKKMMVVVEQVGEPVLNYDDFTASLLANECRYAIFDYDFVTEENCQKSKIFFIAWSPDTARVRSKMIYASSKERFRRELDGIQVELLIEMKAGRAHRTPQYLCFDESLFTRHKPDQTSYANLVQPDQE